MVISEAKAEGSTTAAPSSGRRIVSRAKSSSGFKLYATGKRKTSVARVWLTPGDGTIKVNRRAFEDYFPLEPRRLAVLKPLELTNQRSALNVNATVRGGGPTGQAEAIRHGIGQLLFKASGPAQCRQFGRPRQQGAARMASKRRGQSKRWASRPPPT